VLEAGRRDHLGRRQALVAADVDLVDVERRRDEQRHQARQGQAGQRERADPAHPPALALLRPRHADAGQARGGGAVRAH